MRTLPANEGFPYGTAASGCYLAGCTNGTAPRAENTLIIDTETQIDMEGFLMICEDCATRIANLLGCLGAEEAVQLYDRLRKTEEQLLDESKKVAELKARMQGALVG